MANINSVVDTLSFREANKSQKIILDEFYKTKVQEEFTRRYADIESRISNTDDIITLQHLDSTQKFYRTIATYLDMLNTHIEYLHTTFDHIDETYWNGCIHYQKITDENKFLKDTVHSLQIREDLISQVWRSQRRKWNQDGAVKKVA